MKTTKASTNATTYGEYLEKREKELQEDVEFWHRAWKDTRAENAALKARVANLVEDCDALERRLGDVRADRDEWRHCNAMLQDENAALKERVAELEAERDKDKNSSRY